MKKMQIIQVPYDSGHHATRMGQGPGRFVQGGIDQLLRSRGYEVAVERIETSDPFPTEISTAFEIARLLSRQVQQAVRQGHFPLVLAGNCSSCLGTLAGIDAEAPGVIWFDGHGDFNTPETTGSGFFDGMALAVATGQCFRKLASTIPGFSPVAEGNVILLGVSELGPEEQEWLERSEVQVVGAKGIKEQGISAVLTPALETLKQRVRGVYVHIDLDVLDPQQTPANTFAAPGGLLVRQVQEAIHLIQEHLTVYAAALTAYDPAVDPTHATLEAGIQIIEVLTAG